MARRSSRRSRRWRPCLELFLSQPGEASPGVGQGLQGGEGLGDDDEQGGLRVEALGLLGQVVRVDVGDVAGGDARVGRTA